MAPPHKGPGKGPHSGSCSRASQPWVPARFDSVSRPPCASAICRDSTSPIPDPVGLVVKNGTNRFAVSGRPGRRPRRRRPATLFSRPAPTARALRRPSSRAASTALRDQVDQQLIELVAVGPQRDVEARTRRRPAAGSPGAPHAATHSATSTRPQVWARQPGQLGIGGEEPGQRLGAVGDEVEARAADPRATRSAGAIARDEIAAAAAPPT